MARVLTELTQYLLTQPTKYLNIIQKCYQAE
jgi:hypothetical protein